MNLCIVLTNLQFLLHLQPLTLFHKSFEVNFLIYFLIIYCIEVYNLLTLRGIY